MELFNEASKTAMMETTSKPTPASMIAPLLGAATDKKNAMTPTKPTTMLAATPAEQQPAEMVSHGSISVKMRMATRLVMMATTTMPTRVAIVALLHDGETVSSVMTCKLAMRAMRVVMMVMRRTMTPA